METDKPKTVFISSLVFLVVICTFYLSTYLPRNTGRDTVDYLLHQRESDLNAITVPQSGTTEITGLPYSRDAASELDDDTNHVSSQPNPKDVQINQHSENLTEADILMLIAELEEQSEALLQEEKEKSRLAFKLQNDDEALFQAYEIERDLAQGYHDTVEAEFEREVLGGRSVHEVVTTASDEELEKFRAHPQSQMLTDACLELHELIDTFAAQHHVNIDRMNALQTEASEIAFKRLDINNDIADLKAMLR